MDEQLTPPAAPVAPEVPATESASEVVAPSAPVEGAPEALPPAGSEAVVEPTPTPVVEEAPAAEASGLTPAVQEAIAIGMPVTVRGREVVDFREVVINDRPWVELSLSDNTTELRTPEEWAGLIAA